ncbi:VOC family protein [Christiangramia sabulilitoris]|uniref:VOC family protein n=1 Tax=Christiangramia sabulilitoris TaxID=2583991 RepID=A0A550I880_9FLAO|nr:VOC family protein [Christiangramia sabulilitoris]TRO67180.1 VOC family protein [Christiangramia sabulilitoris]
MKSENPVVWFEIYVNDLDRAKSFYEKVFKTELSPLGDPTEDNLQMLAFPGDMDSKGKTSGALVHVKEVKAGGNSTIVYFGSEDCSVEEARVEDAGGELVRPKMSIGEYGFISLAKDSEGNMIGIHSMK